jgi:RHS repeat-associated protein
VWNPTGSIAQLLMDSSNAYIYGPGRTPIEQVSLSSGTVQYLTSDSLGSVRGIVSASGSLTATTAYDAWGKPETSGGVTSTTPFGYSGSYTDLTGLAYLIKRYYDPTTGQFVSVDPLVDDTAAPYAYAGDDPVRESDPSGACAVAGLNFGANISWSGASTVLPFPPGPVPIPVPKPSATVLGAAAVAIVVVAASGGAQEAKPRMLYRFGFAWESAPKLEEDASAAEAAGFPHGVSVLSKLPPGRSASSAVRANVEAQFAVVKTGKNPYHYTVVLPKPVTEKDAATFNALFGRLAA